jgi:FkbM family methyltransferase
MAGAETRRDNSAQPRVQNRTWNIRLAQRIGEYLARHPFRGSGAAGLYAGRMLVDAPKGPTTVETAYGIYMTVDPVADQHFYGIEPALYYTGAYERGTLEVMRAILRPGDCYVDAGANIGTMALWAAKLVGPSGGVYCFEPEPEVYAVLAHNIALNKLEHVHAFNCALGSNAGTATIYRAPRQNRGSATLSTGGVSALGSEVRVLTLDEVVASERIGPIRLLKVDVEGWELEVLKGAANLLADAAHAPALCLEYSRETHDRRHEAAADVYSWLRSINRYQVYKLKHGKQNISQLVPIMTEDELPEHDNLFCMLPEQTASVDAEIFAALARTV